MLILRVEKLSELIEDKEKQGTNEVDASTWSSSPSSLEFYRFIRLTTNVHSLLWMFVMIRCTHLIGWTNLLHDHSLGHSSLYFAAIWIEMERNWGQRTIAKGKMTRIPIAIKKGWMHEIWTPHSDALIQLNTWLFSEMRVIFVTSKWQKRSFLFHCCLCLLFYCSKRDVECDNTCKEECTSDGVDWLLPS